jgi:hypothetical protein
MSLSPSHHPIKRWFPMDGILKISRASFFLFQKEKNPVEHRVWLSVRFLKEK